MLRVHHSVQYCLLRERELYTGADITEPGRAAFSLSCDRGGVNYSPNNAFLRYDWTDRYAI
jgi:hypothetical protein